MADLKSDDRHDGQERVPKRMAQDHRPLRQPLRLRRAYELPGQHLEHAGARHASDDRQGNRRERQRSEEHTSELRHGYISYAVFCLKKKKKQTIRQTMRSWLRYTIPREEK